MRALDRRVVALERNAKASLDGGRLFLDRLTDEQLDRLERLLVARDSGEWRDISELGDDDLRLLAMIRVGGETE